MESEIPIENNDHRTPKQHIIEQNTTNSRILLVDLNGLAPLDTRPGICQYVKQIWNRRFFIITEARSKAFRATRSYRLWRFWMIINPVLDVLLYGFLFGFLFKTSRGIDNFIGFLFLGIIFMKMITSLLTSGSGLINNSRSMIRAFSFPRASIPISHSLRAMMDNSIPAVVSIVAAFCLQWGTPPNWTIVLVLPLYFLIHVFGAGLMMAVARLTAEIPDAKALIGVIVQAWFFLSGVLYSVDRFKEFELVHQIMSLNPAYLFLTAVRDVTIYRGSLDLSTWLQLIAWSIGTFAIGFVYFWQAEEKYVRLA